MPGAVISAKLLSHADDPQGKHYSPHLQKRKVGAGAERHPNSSVRAFAD